MLVRSGAWRLTPDLRYQKKVWTSEFIGGFKQTQGTETSQYLEERTSTETPLVVASERGPGQWRTKDNRNSSGKLDLRGGQSRTGKTFVPPRVRRGTCKTCLTLGGHPP